MKLSIVSTLYYSSPHIPEFYQRICSAAESLVGSDYEIILVNDGSPDDSLGEALRLHQEDPHVVVIDLSRNFGHHHAMMVGLSHSCGQRIFLIDSDLEEEPDWLLKFSQHMESTGADVVYGVQENRRGSLLDGLFALVFYRLFRLLTGVNQPDNIVTARLMSRRYVDALLLHQEREINIGGLWVITGFFQAALAVKKLSSSPTTYSFSKKCSHLVNAITSFSSLPLAFTFYSGIVISASAVLYILRLSYRTLVISSPPEGYASLIASIWLFSGLIIIFIGIQGIYLSKIFLEVKQRPNTIVRAIHRRANRTNT